jgi:hypothetical protein
MTAVSVSDWANEPTLEDLARLLDAVAAIDPGPATIVDLATCRCQRPPGSNRASLARRMPNPPAEEPVEPEALAAAAGAAACFAIGAAARLARAHRSRD